MTRKIGRYEILGDLAQGGMAEILLARLVGESGFERPVVIKRIRADLDHTELARFFLDEARVVARVRHANVVDVEDLGKDDDGSPYIVMEYVEGESLSNVSRRLFGRNEKWPPALSAFVVAQACAGLHAAHELQDPDGNPLNLVHRDVSPQNILVGYDGTVKVADFGIAKTAKSEETDAKQLRGKWGYMAPEQLMRGRLDRRTDVFALGIVLYELATGHRLFKRFGPTQTAQAILKDPIVPPGRVEPSVPEPIAAVCMRALARPIEERYASATDMRRDLLAALRALHCDEPEAELAAMMTRCFADRIEEKKGLVRNVREGSVVSRLPAADVDVTVEIPGVDEESTIGIPSQRPPPVEEAPTSEPNVLIEPSVLNDPGGSSISSLTTTAASSRERRSPALWLVPMAAVIALVAGIGVRSAIRPTTVAVAPAPPPSAPPDPTPSDTPTASAPVVAIAASSSPPPRAPDPPRKRGRGAPPPANASTPAATPQPQPQAPDTAAPPPSASNRGFRRFQ